MPAISQLLISNRALARLPANPIADVNENSLEARECRRFYPEVISEMMEGPGQLAFASKRIVLAPIANSRTAEWAFSYALPADLGSPVRVIPDFDSLGLSIPVPLPGEPYAEVWATQLAMIAEPYEIQGSVLYTNAAGATLDYITSDGSGLQVSQPVLTALEIDLAARLAVPVKQDQAREQALMGQAEVAWQRAIANDRNRQPESYGGYLPESIVARHGGL